MIEKISLNLSVKSSNQDERIIIEAVSKSQASSDKDKKFREEDAFNTLIEEKRTEEFSKVNLKKKVKRQEDSQGIFIPIFAYQTPIIEEHYLTRIKNSKKKRCSKCGDLFDPEIKDKEKSKVNNISYICQSCLNSDIESFLRENYL